MPLVLTLLGYLVWAQPLSVAVCYSHSSLSGFWQSLLPMYLQAGVVTAFRCCQPWGSTFLSPAHTFVSALFPI